jgi:hypothetical protein
MIYTTLERKSTGSRLTDYELPPPNEYYQHAGDWLEENMPGWEIIEVSTMKSNTDWPIDKE